MHYAAYYDAGDIVDIALKAGADPHKTNENGDTAFNFAAANSPSAGRRMTLQWYRNAQQGDGPGLNAPSGSHESRLIQYAAKWCNAETIKEMLETEFTIDGQPQRVDPFVANDSGWTPLHAAACMPGRAKVVKELARAYKLQPDYLFMRTTEPYTARYRSPKGEPVEVQYPADATAIDLIDCRLRQDTGLARSEKETLNQAKKFIRASQLQVRPDAAVQEMF